MPYTMQDICEEMSRRRSSMTPLIEKMMDVRDRYNADVVVPVAETDDDVPLDSLNPLLIADAVDHSAMYAAQAAPNIFVPAIDMAKMTGVRSTDYAMRRRKALYYSWDVSWWEMVLGRMFRHLAAYATSALVVELDLVHNCPRVTTRDPLSSYPEPKAPEDLTLPANVGFIFGKSLDWLHHNYPQTRDRFPRGSGFAVGTSSEGEVWDLVEWMDDEEIVLGVLGPRDAYHSWTRDPVEFAFELDRYPNVLGVCPAVCPKRVTLDRIASQLANLTGHVDLMAKLMYLDIRATERSVFPDRYVLSKTGQNPRLAHGSWLDGESGEINMIIDGDAVGVLPATPDPNNKITMDRLERNIRVSSGLVPQAGGETYGALRTGRGIDALMGAALDPRTTELHRIAGRYLTSVNERMLLAYRWQWPARTFSVYSPLDPGAAEFVPEQHVERDPSGELFVDNRVYYPIPGMDDINATQVIGQMQGTGLISNYDARRMHPHVTDPEGTERRMLVEQMEALLFQSIAQRAATPPGIPPKDVARMIELLHEGFRPHEAVARADAEAQRRQAAIDAESTEMGAGPMPEQMPGLANPGEGAEMGGGAIQGAPAGVDRLRELVGAMQSTTPPAPGGP